MRWLAACVTAVCLAGCTQWHYELGEPLAETATRSAAESQHLGTVLELLGPPHRVNALADGYVLGWEHWRIRERSLGISLGALGVELMSIDWGHARLAGEFLLLRFDSQHRLTAHAFHVWDERGGGGSALQPSVALVDVVDVDDLLEPLSQHRWGSLSLGSLPITLNRDNSPDSGAATLEQRGTPTGAGQRSLEMRN